MAGKKLFCEFDSSQSCHCLQLANQQWIELLALKFFCRNFVYRRLAQGPSRSRSVFFKLHRWIPRSRYQSRRNIGIYSNNPQHLIKKLRPVCHCLREASLKLSIAKFFFAVKKVDFLGRKITPRLVRHRTKKMTNSYITSNFSDPKRHSNHTSDFWITAKNHSRLAQGITPFFSLLKTTDAKNRKLINTEIWKKNQLKQQKMRQLLPTSTAPATTW